LQISRQEDESEDDFFQGSRGAARRRLGMAPPSTVYFTGSPTGTHTLAGDSTQDRIDAHWNGYREAVSEFLDRLPAKVDKVISFLNDADPSATGKYATWLFSLFKNSHRITDDVHVLNELLIEFDQKKHRLPVEHRDINKYDTPGELSKVMREHFKESRRGLRKRLVGSGLERIYEDDDYTITKITNAEAANKLGQGTRWCIKDDALAKQYLRSGPFYYIELGEDIDEGYGPYLAHSSHSMDQSGHRVELKDVDNDEVREPGRLVDIFAEIDKAFICQHHHQFRSQMCPACELSTDCEECTPSCSDCGADGCGDCLYVCHVCDDMICAGDTHTCEDCNQAVCRECLIVCHCCGNAHVCESCANECQARTSEGYRSCDHNFCARCDDNQHCAECERTMCRCCITGCDECGSGLCEYCSKQCQDCGSSVCPSHLDEREEDSKRVCDGCL